MMDTIELLSAIGGDATLRHASADELAPILERAQASEALRSAVAAGDSAFLVSELDPKPNQAPQITNAPAHEEEEPAPDGNELPLPSEAVGRKPNGQ